MKSRWMQHVIMFMGFVDLLGVSIFLTTLPGHIRSFGVSASGYGAFMSLYGCLQLLTSSTLGLLVDRVGVLLLLRVCSFCCVVGYTTLALAPTFYWLCFARVITGVFKHTQMLLKLKLMECASTSDDIPLSASLTSKISNITSRFATSSALGFVIGPSMVGFIFADPFMKTTQACNPATETCSQRYSSFKLFVSATACGFFLIFVLSMLCLQEKEHEKIQSKKKTERSRGTQRSLYLTWDLLAVQGLMSTSATLPRTTLSINFEERFQADTQFYGYASSCSALFGIIGSSTVAWITGRQLTSSDWQVSGVHALQISLGLSVAGLLGCFLSLSLAPVIAIFTPYMLGPLLFLLAYGMQGFSNAVARESLSVCFIDRLHSHHLTASSTIQQDTGAPNFATVLGFSGSLLAAIRLVVPVLGGYLFDVAGWELNWYASIVSALIASALLNTYSAKQKLKSQ